MCKKVNQQVQHDNLTNKRSHACMQSETKVQMIYSLGSWYPHACST